MTFTFRTLALLLAISTVLAAAAAAAGVTVRYRLPTDGPLPQTYRVTLAAVDAKNADWIVSTFAAGVVRTVTAENRGEFTETWDGLDDNFMPAPPGTYAIKGIFMPAREWDVDRQWHSIVPRYLTEASAWRAMPGECKPPSIVGDPSNTPIGDVDVGGNGVGVFTYQYLENSRNFYVVDFNRPIDYQQLLASYNSGGAAGGPCTATDGKTAWCFENEGFVFRTDEKRFGGQDGRYRKGVHQPEGYVTAMAAWRDEPAGKSLVYLAERGKIVHKEKGWPPFDESPSERVDKIVVLDGDTAARLAELPAAEPRGVVARWGDRLWGLHQAGGKWVVSAAPLKHGLPQGDLRRVLAVPADITPNDLEVDSRGRMYLADAAANKVYQFAADGKPLRTFGRLSAQRPGSYDRQTFMAPEKLACWRTADGRDRLVVVERQGIDRVSEWDPDDGTLLREWLSAQTFTNQGYAVDPRRPDRFYLQGHGGWLICWRVDYATGAWQPEAVWPNVFPADSPLGWGARRTLAFPKIIYRGDTRYLVFNRGAAIFRETAAGWAPSAAIISEYEKNMPHYFVWRDANGDGRIQDDEFRPNPTTPPKGTMRYWGETWLDDFSLVAIQEGQADVWRLAPTGFDAHGNPRYDPAGWTRLLTDPVLAARRNGTATALFGGNEIADSFCSSWGLVAGSLDGGLLLTARGPDLSANFGAQQKLSRYVPDGRGGFRLQWRVGRMAIHGVAQPGEMYGCIHLVPPIGGLITLVDQSRMGLLLYTEDGLYVDTLFADDRAVGKTAGPYTQPGEYFAGYSFCDRGNDKVYLALGKTTPMLFEAVGWSGSHNPVRRLETVQPQVELTSSQIAPAPEFALAVRRKQRGGSTARVARFAPIGGGGPALDGSLRGWESCEPVRFQADDRQSVEVRCGYDPQQIYLRWHARLGRKFVPKPLAAPERIFTHDRESDTLSFYLQGDPAAPPAKGRAGRPGDMRFVFGIVGEGAALKPVVLGMYPQWFGTGPASPLTYKSPTGTAVFAHVGLIGAAKLGYLLDADGQGFVIAAALPRAALPKLPEFSGEWLTQVNFDATFGGHNRFWWANADGSATRETYDEPTEAQLYPGSWSQAQFEAIDGLPIRVFSAIGPFGFAGLPQLRHREDRTQVVKQLFGAVFPPEEGIDLAATYTGAITQTRRQQRKLAWRPASTSVELLQLGDALGWQSHEDEGTAYCLTYVHSPAAAEVACRALDRHGHHRLQIWLNDKLLGELPSLEAVQKAEREGKPTAATHALALKAGWNKLLVRYDQIWGDLAFGLRLEGKPAALWGLRFSATPPEP